MPFIGGCQCGKVRYRAHAPVARASVCYCRMCQRAGAAPFMAFARFPADSVEWSSPPAIFASSNLVERGFCRDCGTPLSYRQTGGRWLSVTLMTLDDPEAVRPALRYSPRGEVSWCRGLETLPEGELAITGPEAGMVSHQSKVD
jgi:hypothetical protein